MQKFIGRVTTDTDLNRLYQLLLESVAVIMVDAMLLKFGVTFGALSLQPSPAMQRQHHVTFRKRRGELVSACRRKDVKAPKQLSFGVLERIILRSQLAASSKH